MRTLPFPHPITPITARAFIADPAAPGALPRLSGMALRALPSLASALAALFLLAALPSPLAAREVPVPEALRPWMAWVAEKHPNLPCPLSQGGDAVCVTYGSLKLELDGQGGTFTQAVLVFGSQWVRLPGAAAAWPKDTRDGGAAVPVVLRHGYPQVKLGQGEHTLTGGFAWTEMPPSLTVPDRTALLTLRLKGKEVAVPEMSGDGTLQLGALERKDSLEEEAPLTLRVYRKLVDGIPMRLETHLSISVSGREREIVTGRFLPQGSAVLSMSSHLPARIGADGRLRAQLRSGVHKVVVVSRFLAPTARVGAESLDSLWPKEEIWSFEAQRDLRVVEVGGAPLIDPSQSGLPPEWKGLPAYRLASGDTLRLEEKQRGNAASAAVNLQLRRDLWLDFAGRGFTVKDNLWGALPLRSRLEMNGDFRLGRAESHGQPVMITSLRDKAGVEMPAGSMNMLALSRFDRDKGRLPATGWNQDFQDVQATLHLPPGWKLVHAEGPDGVAGSWINDWSLWDVFLLCILTLGVLRLAGMVPALIAVAAFVLLSQEAGLSGLLWLNLLAALGLWKALPAGRLRDWANVYRIASFTVMAAIWIPFAIVHARKALYPQLDGPESTAFNNANSSLLAVPSGTYSRGSDQMVLKMAEPEHTPQPAPPEQGGEGMADDPEAVSQSGSAADMDASPGVSPASPRKRFAQRRAKAKGGWDGNGPVGGSGGLDDLQANRFNYAASKVQSGPGEPVWNWETANLTWSGPVQRGEDVKLILTRPWLTRILRALQALLPGALLLLLAFPEAAGLGKEGRRGGKGGKGGMGGIGGIGRGGSRGGTAGGALAALALLSLGAGSARAEFPPEALLQQLEERMSAPRDCAPSCAGMNSGRVEAKGDRLSVHLLFDVQDTSLALLPQAGEGQFALQAVRLGGRPAAGAVQLDNGRLAIALPRGRHAVTLEGRILGSRMELNFGDEARNLSVLAPEYSTQGLSQGRTENGALVLQRREASATVHLGPELTPDPVPPFVEVYRRLILDQEWTLETRVIRIAPAEGAFTVEVPLLPFEHPTTPGMAQSKGTAMATLREGEDETAWRSVVDRATVLKLTAGNLDQRAETWSVDASSRWHVEAAGIPPVLPRGGKGDAEWKPMPGDTLSLGITEPAAASGSVKTIERAALTVRPRKRENTGSLEMNIRAGQGDVTRVELPPGAKLESMFVDEAAQPLTQREGLLALPLHPGLQRIQLTWKQPEGIRLFQKTPKVKLEDEAANLSITAEMPGDRWVLWVGGNAIGPALLLWGVLVVLIGIAWLLGRSRITPLGFADWALLFAGTSMVNVYATAPLLALFLALRYRSKSTLAWKPAAHNLFQIAVAGLALLGFGMLLAAVPEGLLSAPDMQVTGNGSYQGTLHWFQDRAQGDYPMGWVFSLPLWVYRLAMLAWSLWLAFRLLQWLRWCWERFSEGGIWRPVPKKPAPVKAPPKV